MELVAEYRPTDHRHQLGVMDLALLLDALESFGISPKQLLLDIGLEAIDWQDEQAQITYADKLMLFRHLNQKLPNLGLGLLVGERATLSHFGVLGYAILSSRSVEEAIKTGFKYLNFNGPVFSVKVVKDHQNASIVLDNVLDIGDLLPFCCEYFFSALTSLFEELTGQKLETLALSLPYSEPSYSDSYRERFGCETEFEAESLSLCFSAQTLSLPLKTHNTDMLSHYLQSCESVVSLLQSPHRLTNQIKAILYQSVGAFPSIEEMAEQYGCSSRTLRRQLSLHHTSYHQLVGEVRSDLAKEFLLRTELTIEEIAFRLGYSDAANFRRGFKRWTGMTPQRFR